MKVNSIVKKSVNSWSKNIGSYNCAVEIAKFQNSFNLNKKKREMKIDKNFKGIVIPTDKKRLRSKF